MGAVALVLAAGRGERLGASGPKAFVALGGRPMLEWSLAALDAVPEITSIVLAMPPVPVGFAAGHRILVEGGAQRSHSVRNALAAAPADSELVLVHDAARPLVTPELVRACLDATREEGVAAAIAAAPVTDTIKEAAADGRTVARTLERRALWAVQTPQVFRRAALARALEQPDAALAAATDDAGLVEAQGGAVRLVPSSARNLKVTTPTDLRLAELLLAEC